MSYDFFAKRQEGDKRLRQAVVKRDNQVGFRRFGCQFGANGNARRVYPRTFAMTSEAGYRSRVIAPKMDGDIEKEGFPTAMCRMLGNFRKRMRPNNLRLKARRRLRTSGIIPANRWEAFRPITC